MNRALAVLLLVPLVAGLVAGLVWLTAGETPEEAPPVARGEDRGARRVADEAPLEVATPDPREVAPGAGARDEGARETIRAEADEPRLPADRVLVHGRVIDVDGQPVPGARIQYCRQRHDKLTFADLAPRADADGRYGVRPETQHWYPLRAWAPGFGAHHRGPFSPNKYAQQEVDFVLGDGEPLAGRVVLAGGAPAVGARVEVQRVIGADLMTEDAPNVHMAYRDSLQPIGYDVVAADGTFGLRGLLDGPYRVIATLTRADGTQLMAVAEDVPTRERDLRLELAAPLTVVAEIVDERGAPVTEQYLNLEPLFHREEALWDEALKVRTGALEAADGRYEVQVPFAGRWTLWPNKRGFVVPRELRERVYTFPRAEPVRLQLTRMASLAGTVTDAAGKKLAGIEVRLYRGAGGQPRAKTDAEGAFHFAYASPGALEIRIGADEEPAVRLPLTLAPGEERTGVALVLGGVGVVEVALLDADGNPTPEGRWIELRQGELEHEGKSDAKGRARFEGVPPGRWSLLGLAGEDRGNGHAEMMAQLVTEEIEVEAGEVTRVTLRALHHEPVKLYGRATRDGEPLAGAKVYALRDGGVAAEAGDGESVRKDGSYELEVPRAGLYLVNVGVDDRERGGKRRNYLRAVEVTRGERQRLDIEVESHRITGVVRHPGGAPAVDVLVTVEALDGRWALFLEGLGTTTRTDEHGAFAVDGLEAELWRVCASDPQTASVACVDDVRAGGPAALGLELTLDASHSLEGTVVGPDGASRRALLFAFDPAGRAHVRRGFQNRRGGDFAFPSRDDRARIYALTEDELCAVAEVRAGEDARLTCTPGGTLELRALDNDGRGCFATLRLEDADGHDVSHLIGTELRKLGMMSKLYCTRVTLGPLPPGSYVASARTASGGLARRTVEVRAGKHEVVELIP